MARLVVGGSIALLLLSACSLSDAHKPGPALIVGAIYPLSGPQAKGGQQELGGVRAALEVAQKQGLARASSVNLRVVDAQTPDQAVAAVDRLVDKDHVQVIIGTHGSTPAGGRAKPAAAGIGSVTGIEYDPHAYDPETVVGQIAAARPDFLWDVSYLDDGVAVWQAVLAAHLPLRAAVGTSSAFCMPDFQKRLGAQAIGVYAADKPDEVVGVDALNQAARSLLTQASARFGSDNHGRPMEIPGVAGFVGGWTLFHDVLPKIRGTATSEAIRTAALTVDVPIGGEIKGGGVPVSPTRSPDAGQNRRAAAVVGQWQAGGVMRVVYPDAYATGQAVFSMTP